MFNGLGAKIRFWALSLMIACDVLFIALLSWKGIWIWAWFVIGVSALVAIFEGLWYSLKRKTISTEYKEFAQHDPIIAYLGLVLFTGIMAFLIVHLAVW